MILLRGKTTRRPRNQIPYVLVENEERLGHANPPQLINEKKTALHLFVIGLGQFFLSNRMPVWSVYSSMTRGGKSLLFLTPSPYSASEPYPASVKPRLVLSTRRMFRRSCDLLGMNGCNRMAEIRSDSATL